MSDRVNITFGELGELFDGPHATPKRTDVGPYFLNISSLVDGRLDLSQSDHVSDEEFVRWTRRVTPQEGDLLFSYETRLGDAALMPPDLLACLGRRMALLRPNRRVIVPAFLLYFYISPGFKELIEKHTIHGATVNRIGLSTMRKWPIEIPGLAEQRGISEVLGAIDDKIAANTKLVATSEQLAVAALAGESTMVPLRDAARLHRITISPDSVHEPTVDHFSLPAFDAGALPAGDSPRDIKSAKFRLDRPVVLLSKLNPRFPRVWNVESLSGRPSLASTEFLVLEPLHSTTAVLWAALSQSAFSLALDAKVGGTSGSHQRVKPEDALDTLIVDPGAVSRDRSALITNVVSLAGRSRGENRILAATRDALLPQLMSGKLRVRDAEKLLEGVL